MVVPPLLHKYEVAELEVSVTEFPWQNESDPFAVMVGMAGLLLTVIAIGEEVAEHPSSLVTVTESEPADETIILAVVAPVLHKYEVAEPAVSVTEFPWQNVVAPLAVMVATGNGLIAIVKVWGVLVPQVLFAVTVTIPPVLFAVIEILFVVDVPTHPLGNVQV